MQVIPTTTPTINLPIINKDKEPINIIEIATIAMISEIIIDPLLPNLIFTFAKKYFKKNKD